MSGVSKSIPMSTDTETNNQNSRSTISYSPQTNTETGSETNTATKTMLLPPAYLTSKTDNKQRMVPNDYIIHRPNDHTPRWQILGKIGRGGFGEICRARDLVLDRDVAVKFSGGRPKDIVRTKREIEVLRKSNENNLKHVPTLIGSGQEPRGAPTITFITMQLLSRNLSDVRREAPQCRLTPATALQCIYQAIEGVRDLHCTVNVIHRDIKPSNMAFGITPVNSRTLYLIDFGLVRQIFDESKNLIPARPHRIGFRGTARYASIRVHDRWEPGRADDLMALFYCLLELTNGSLPWRHIRTGEETKVLKQRYHANRNQMEYLCTELPNHILKLEQLICQTRFEDTPDYEQMLNLIHKAMESIDCKHDDAYDWETIMETSITI